MGGIRRRSAGRTDPSSARAPGRRRAWRLCALVTVVAALLVGAPSLAQAAPFDCKQAPVPQSPGTGVTSVFVHRPSTLPAAEDPFQPGAKTTIYQQYGFAGLRWNTYDLGCGPDASRDPGAVVFNGLANFIMAFPLAAIAATLALLDRVFNPTWLAVFDPLMRNVTGALGGSHWFAVWFPLSLICVGIFLLIRSRRAQYAETAQHAGWVVVVLAAVTFAVGWPLLAGGMFDTVITGSIRTTNTALAGVPNGNASATDAVGSNLYGAVLYRSWLRGEFGSADSATARTYGPQLFQASALTWREADTVQKDPGGQGKKIIEDKQARFKQVAEQVQQDDPDAYQHLTGHSADDRAGYAGLAWVFAVLCCAFFILAALLVVLALLVMRVAVMLLPVVAPAAAFPLLRSSILDKALNVVGGAVYNAVVFGVAVGIYTLTVGFMFGSGLPDWLAVVVLGVLTAVFWRLTRPFRRLLDVIPGQGAARWAVKATAGYLLTKHAVEEGMERTTQSAASSGTAAPTHNAEETASAPPPDLMAVGYQTPAHPPMRALPRVGEPAGGPSGRPTGPHALLPAGVEVPAARLAPGRDSSGAQRTVSLAALPAGTPSLRVATDQHASPPAASLPVDVDVYRRDEELPSQSAPYSVDPEVVNGEPVYRIYQRNDDLVLV